MYNLTIGGADGKSAPFCVMKKMILLGSTAFLLTFAAAGCATSSDIDNIQRQTSSINADLLAMKGDLDDINFSLQAQNKRAKDLQAMVSALAKGQKDQLDDLEVIKRNQADLGAKLAAGPTGGARNIDGQLEELRHEITNTNAKLDALQAALLQKLDEMEKAAAQQKAAPAEGTGGGQTQGAQGQPQPQTPAPTPAPEGDPNQIYQAAYLDYTKGNYDLAIAGFKDYLSKFPDAEFAGNAQYWIAESLYSMGKYDEAVPEFDKVITKYASSMKVPGALLKKGYALDALKRHKDAKEAYQELIKKYPDSEAAKLAEERLKKK